MRPARRAITLAITLGLGTLVFGSASTAQAAEVDLSSYYAARLDLGSAVTPSHDRGQSELSEAEKPILLALAALPEVPRSQLADIRGGFELPGGVTVNFGFTSSTLLQNQGAPVASIAQTFTVSGVASGSSLSGTITQQANGGTATSPIGSGSTSQLVSANQGATQVLTSLTNGGLTTLISNAAPNQSIQHVLTENLDVSGLRQQMSTKVPSFTTLSSALLQANSFNHR
jgi:hypothetical protein